MQIYYHSKASHVRLLLVVIIGWKAGVLVVWHTIAHVSSISN